MISLEVIDTDSFLDMPQSSQLLYFHLNARADDDGFVSSPKKIIRMLGASTDDLKILITKKFVIYFEDGVCVIKHWRINNFIRKDIYKETKYLDLKKSIKIRANGAYTQTDDERSKPIPQGHFQLSDLFVNETSTERQLRLDKVRLDKIRLDKVSKSKYFDEFWNEYPKKKAKAKAKQTWESKKLDKEKKDILKGLKKYKQSQEWKEKKGKFIPYPTTFLNQRRWEDEVEIITSTYKSYD